MTNIDPVQQFILDSLHSDSELVTLCDNKFFNGLLREPVSLTAPQFTRVGIEYVSNSGDGYFFTQIRDFDSTQIQIKITVVSSMGNNDNHCRTVTDAIMALFTTNRKKSTDNYKIFVDNISSSVTENEQARWTGIITMTVMYYVLIPDCIE
jgi:hypothetical protein